jgi:hypothetical protein
MSDPEEQLTFSQLPARVRASFETIRVRLGSELTIGNLRATSGGWVVSIYTADGHNGGDFLVPAEPGEKPHG